MRSLAKRNICWLLALHLTASAVTLNHSKFESESSSSLSAHHRVKRIVGGKQSKAPPVDDPVVFARLFNRDARVEGIRNPNTGIYSFLGIHYAEPPVGQLRYARPVYRRLGGDLNATRHGQPCIQPHPQQPQRIIGDENCLLLNVYTPQMPDETTGLPVFVWIHPGGFRYGSAAQYDATPMAQQGAIVVAPQYRLGSLGIMGDGTKEFDGNLAMFDLSAALRWVTDYISNFGGIPNRFRPLDMVQVRPVPCTCPCLVQPAVLAKFMAWLPCQALPYLSMPPIRSPCRVFRRWPRSMVVPLAMSCKLLVACEG